MALRLLFSALDVESWEEHLSCIIKNKNHLKNGKLSCVSTSPQFKERQTPSRRDGNMSKADNGKKVRLAFKTVK